MIIFSPGPANISDRVRKALTLTDICHRDSEFRELQREIREYILRVCGVNKGFKSVVFSGSGTLAIESTMAALSGWNKKTLIISNGVYGERAAEICRLHGTPIEEIKLPWGVLPDLNQVEAKLKQDIFGALYVVHHETTTGLLNQLPDISAIAKQNGKLVLVDGVSSIAGEEIDLEGWGIDMITGSANKSIRGVPGASFALVSQRFIKTAEECRQSAYYASLLRHLDSEEKGETPFTPAVQVFYAFREALEELLEEGVGSRIDQYRTISKMLREGLRSINLKFYLPDSAMSNTMTAVYLPHDYDYEALHDQCKQRGYVIYASQGKLAANTFRLGTVGVISKSDIEGFLNVLRELLSLSPMKGGKVHDLGLVPVTS